MPKKKPLEVAEQLFIYIEATYKTYKAKRVSMFITTFIHKIKGSTNYSYSYYPLHGSGKKI